MLSQVLQETYIRKALAVAFTGSVGVIDLIENREYDLSLKM